MKFVLGLPVSHIEHGSEFVGQEAIIDMARTAEEAGFDAVSVTDHPVPTGRYLDAAEGHHSQDPFVALATIGAVTRRVRLMTSLLVLPYRNPFLTARAVSTLDSYTGGRVTLGLGAGYLKAEFIALGVPFENRNERFDEYIRAMRTAWENDEFTFKGTGYEALGNRILPRPVQETVPLWIGGNSKEAIRRAVDYGQGWMPLIISASVTSSAKTAAITSLDDLAERVAYLKSYAKEVGKTPPANLCVSVFNRIDDAADARARFEASYAAAVKAGINWSPLGASGRTRAEWVQNVRTAGEWIASMRSRI